MCYRRALLLTIAAAMATSLTPPAPARAQTLSYEYFKANVQPIFLKKRPGHTRCIVCHAGANNAMRLTPLERGATNFSEEQSRTNFETVSRIVVPGKPMESHFLTHPLDPHFGGGMYHSGGRQFETTDDPDWKAMAAWVNGAK
jgi:hypothetical protein